MNVLITIKFNATAVPLRSLKILSSVEFFTQGEKLVCAFYPAFLWYLIWRYYYEP